MRALALHCLHCMTRTCQHLQLFVTLLHHFQHLALVLRGRVEFALVLLNSFIALRDVSLEGTDLLLQLVVLTHCSIINNRVDPAVLVHVPSVSFSCFALSNLLFAVSFSARALT